MNRCFSLLRNWKANVRTLVTGLTLFYFLFLFPGLVEALQTVLVRTSDGGVYQIRFRNIDPRRSGYDLGDFVDDFAIYNRTGAVKLCPDPNARVTWELYTAARILAKTRPNTPIFDTSALAEALEQAVEDQELKPHQIAKKQAVGEVVGHITSGIQSHTLLKGLNVAPKGGPAAVIVVSASLLSKLGNIEIRMRKLLYAFWIASGHANTARVLQKLSNQKAVELWRSINAGEIVDIFSGRFDVDIDSQKISGNIGLDAPLRLRLAAQVYQDNAEKAAALGADLGEDDNAWSNWLLGLTGVGDILRLLVSPIEAHHLKSAMEKLEQTSGEKIERSIQRNIEDIYDSAAFDLKRHGFCSPRLKFTTVDTAVYEGYTRIYTVALNSPPDAVATITISSDNSDATVLPPVLTFTPRDWYRPKPVTLHTLQDTDNVNDWVYLRHTSTDYGDNLSRRIKFTILGRKGNNFPESVDTIAPLTLSVGDDFRLDLAKYFRDPENAKLIYWANSEDFNMVSALPDRSGSWITIKPRKVGSTRVIAGATDPEGLRVSQTFTVTVTAARVNAAPTAINTIPDQTLIVGNSPLSLNLANYFQDPDGDSLIYAAGSKPTGIVKVERKGPQITIVPISAGSTTVTVGAADPEGLRVFWQFSLTVTAPQVQQPPVPEPANPSFDLAIQSISPNKKNLSPGEFFTLNITVRNKGPGTSLSRYLSYYHSSAQGRFPTDPPQLQGTVPLNPIAPGESTTKSIRLQAPSTPSTYYYGAWLAANTGDTDIHNDVGTEVGVTVMATTVQTPNLPNPDVPSTPNIPTPDVPNTKVPSTPDIPTPDIPQTKVPSTPDIPTPDIPQTKVPSTPDIPTPDIPQTKVPSTPINA
jgi:hypothetical protein